MTFGDEKLPQNEGGCAHSGAWPASVSAPAAARSHKKGQAVAQSAVRNEDRCSTQISKPHSYHNAPLSGKSMPQSVLLGAYLS